MLMACRYNDFIFQGCSGQVNPNIRSVNVYDSEKNGQFFHRRLRLSKVILGQSGGFSKSKVCAEPGFDNSPPVEFERWPSLKDMSSCQKFVKDYVKQRAIDPC